MDSDVGRKLLKDLSVECEKNKEVILSLINEIK